MASIDFKPLKTDFFSMSNFSLPIHNKLHSTINKDLLLLAFECTKS